MDEFRDDEIEISPAQVVNTTLIQQGEASLIRSMVATAKEFPRKETQIERKIIGILSLPENKAFAEKCQYALPRGNKKIVGPSVHLAKFILKHYGNARASARIVDISETHVTSEAFCWDLESNTAISVEVKKGITSKDPSKPNGRVRYNEDMITVTCNAANATALRNAIFAVVPKNLVDSALQAAQDSIIGQISNDADLKAAQTKIVSTMMEAYSVTEQEILALVGKNAVQYLTKNDIQTLFSVHNSLKDGDTTIEECFNRAPKSKVQGKTMHDKIKEADAKNVTHQPAATTPAEPAPASQPQQNATTPTKNDQAPGQLFADQGA